MKARKALVERCGAQSDVGLDLSDPANSAPYVTKMKPRERPSASPPNDGRLPLTVHWGATPCIKIVPHQWLGTPTLHGARPYVPREFGLVRTKGRSLGGSLELL
jgi:hypothetical protein